MQPYNHFTLSEREYLRELAQSEKSIREIARMLGRSASSISRELKRGSGKQGYNAWYATCVYMHRRKQCRQPSRIAKDRRLREFIEASLEKYWSPEIIVAKWKETNKGAKLSHCTIYRAIKNGPLQGYPAQKYLIRRDRLKYKKGNSQTIHPDHVIAERPEEANKRKRIGDWEGDTIRGAIGKGALFTCIDRMTRCLTARLVQDMRAETVGAVMCEALGDKPVQTLTLDRGSEFAEFRQTEQKLGCTIYFADPHSPWQRGSNENINGLLRFFFPKGTNFMELTQRDVDFVVDLINTRPRKCLHWLSPKDFFSAKCCT